MVEVSDNPQTFNQALLLIANLARIAPEFATHSVMPVFTFMGSNVFHRDDSYSFRVVQKVCTSVDLEYTCFINFLLSEDYRLYCSCRDNFL